MTERVLLDKFYEIDFDDGQRVHTLRYQVVDSPVSRLWLERTRFALAQTDCHIFGNQWMTTVATEVEIHALWKKMKGLVDEANSGRYIKVDHIEMADDIDLAVDNRPALNYLHYRFHEFEEHVAATNNWVDGYDPLIQLNVDIHKLEAMIGTNSQTLTAGFFLHSLTLEPMEYAIQEHEKAELYDYFYHDPSFGDLLLGYHTVGKNIYHCWKDNDIELVKKGMVRPQRTISNEVVLFFNRHRGTGGSAFNRPGEYRRVSKQVIQWVADNNLDQYVDMSQPEHQITSCPLVAQLVDKDNIDFMYINEIFKTSKIVETRVIE